MQAENADGDVLAWFLEEAPKGLAVGLRNGMLKWRPTTEHLGRNMVRVGVSDGQASAIVSFGLLVAPLTKAQRLDVFDIRGQRVRRLAWPEGRTKLHWDGRSETRHSVAAGVYFFDLTTDTFHWRWRAMRLR